MQKPSLTAAVANDAHVRRLRNIDFVKTHGSQRRVFSSFSMLIAPS